MPGDAFAQIAPIAIVPLVLAGAAAYAYWLVRSQPSDVTHIKARLEANEHRVVDVRREGFVPGGRSTPSYRTYRVVVRSPLSGLDEVHTVGVEAGFFTDGAVHEFGGPARHRDFG